jgi:hypothetical protein
MPVIPQVAAIMQQCVQLHSGVSAKKTFVHLFLASVIFFS